jgi:hypothetical protein
MLIQQALNKKLNIFDTEIDVKEKNDKVSLNKESSPFQFSFDNVELTAVDDMKIETSLHTSERTDNTVNLTNIDSSNVDIIAMPDMDVDLSLLFDEGEQEAFSVTKPSSEMITDSQKEEEEIIVSSLPEEFLMKQIGFNFGNDHSSIAISNIIPKTQIKPIEIVESIEEEKDEIVHSDEPPILNMSGFNLNFSGLDIGASQMELLNKKLNKQKEDKAKK